MVCRDASSLLLFGSSEERCCLWVVDKAAATSRITGTMLLPYRQVLDMILKEDTDVHASHLLHGYAKWDFIHILMSLISYATICFCLKDTYGMFCERWVWMR